MAKDWHTVMNRLLQTSIDRSIDSAIHRFIDERSNGLLAEISRLYGKYEKVKVIPFFYTFFMLKFKIIIIIITKEPKHNKLMQRNIHSSF